MASTRLPGKVLLDVAGKPMLAHVVGRLQRATSVDDVVVATSSAAADNPVSDYCAAQDFACFRGDEYDVLDRFYRAATERNADVVVRVTADCPLIDPDVVDRAVALFRQGADYVSTRHPPFPDGVDVEVFSMASLERAWRETTSATDREHVTPSLRRADDLRRALLDDAPPLPPGGDRWTVDEQRDLDFVRAVYERLEADEYAGIAAVADLLWKEPELTQLNSGIARNEGLYRSIAEEPALPSQDLNLERSRELAEKAARLIPSSTQTFSKGPTQFVRGVSPTFLERGSGSHVWDVDGNEYIDYAMALGPIILGHAFPEVDDAVDEQVRRGIAFSLPHPLEIEVAQQLVELVPCAEMVRFGKNGSDATSGAVRAARAFTGREVIACCGYHGWQDWYIGTTTRSLGVPGAVKELTVSFAYNDLATLERIFEEHPGQVAAVVMEPVGIVPPEAGFLEAVRDVTTREGALLVYDEVVTGFRLALGGAQELFGVTPDLAAVGKAMGNGFPIAAVVGRRDVMEIFDEIFFSFTFGGEAASLAAAKATLTVLREQDVIPHLWAQGQVLHDGFNTLAEHFELEKTARCVGLSPRTVLSFFETDGHPPLLLKSLFQQECIRRGVLFTGGQNICFSHSDADVEHTLRVYRAAFEVLRKGIDDGAPEALLEGAPVEAVFRAP
jgi:glutamate-1-semialdehyde-2,1-aminomutase